MPDSLPPPEKRACEDYMKMAQKQKLAADPRPRRLLPVAELKANLTKHDGAWEHLTIYSAIFRHYLDHTTDAQHDPDLDGMAQRALSVANLLGRHWDSGNVIHIVHLVLGQVALAQNDLAQAVAQLHLAAQTPGSPQLNSFGPNMALAERLLRLNQGKEVITYIRECKRFWVTDMGRAQEWISSLELGVNPDFGGNLDYGVEREPTADAPIKEVE